MVKTNKLKPLAKTHGAALLVRRDRLHVTRALEEAIFVHADVLSEGGVRLGSVVGHSTYFGSTMISVELSRLGVYARGLSEEAARAAIVRAIDGSVRVRLRAMRMARAEAARRVQHKILGTALCEIQMRVSGRHLHIDVDLEVPLRVSSRSARPA